jgi:hypothetical protein
MMEAKDKDERRRKKKKQNNIFQQYMLLPYGYCLFSQDDPSVQPRG